MIERMMQVGLTVALTEIISRNRLCADRRNHHAGPPWPGGSLARPSPRCRLEVRCRWRRWWVGLLGSFRLRRVCRSGHRLNEGQYRGGACGGRVQTGILVWREPRSDRGKVVIFGDRSSDHV